MCEICEISKHYFLCSACDDNSLKENTEDGAKGESGEAASQLILGSGDYHGDLRSNEQGIRNQSEYIWSTSGMQCTCICI